MAHKSVQPDFPDMQRAWAYARVSTTDQADSGVSLDERERRVRGRAMELGLKIEHVFVEEGISGSTPLSRRPQGSKLLAAVRPGDTIIAAKLDRVFRSALDALQVIQDLKRRNIHLILLDIGDVTNGTSELVLTIMAAVAQFERERTVERIRDSKTQLRHEGRHQGGVRPFGYRLSEEAPARGKARELIPDETEQAAIAEMLAMREAGMTLMAVRDEMRRRGFRVSHQLVADIERRAAKAAAS